MLYDKLVRVEPAPGIEFLDFAHVHEDGRLRYAGWLFTIQPGEQNLQSGRFLYYTQTPQEFCVKLHGSCQEIGSEVFETIKNLCTHPWSYTLDVNFELDKIWEKHLHTFTFKDENEASMFKLMV